MWLKSLLLVSSSLVILTSAGPPIKVKSEFNLENENFKLPLVDPIDGISYRLPNNTVPIHYDIHLSTDIHVPIFAFDGVVKIQIRALEDTSEITVHTRQLVILNINLLSSSGVLIEENVDFGEESVQEFLIIRPQLPLLNGQEYYVEISYIGTLRNDDAGFYRSSYTHTDSTTKWLATTQFESTDARHAFPCYDEPQLRTSFTIEIKHHRDYNALSNMPVDTRTDVTSTEYVVTKFQKIESVQTYLIAFTVSDFTFVEDNSVVPPQRVYAKAPSIDNGEGSLALRVSPELLLGFEEYLGVNYTLPKMDQVALPDFAAGAMENWGLVTYREIYLLFNPATGTTRNHENIVLTIAHEFAHQWFGDLVCPEWWSYLWLNEGFATLYENYITELVYPNERWDDTFLTDTLQAVFETDSNPSRRPMTYYVENPDNIDGLFDNIAYSKSGSVLYTFLHAFGDLTWKKGLNYYLNTRMNNYANSDHLYAGLQQAVAENYSTNTPDVRTIMRSWETQSGFPLITISRNANNELIISQQRFFYTNTSSSDSQWYVPINYATASNSSYAVTTADFWLNGVSSMTLRNNAAPKSWTANDWILFNIQETYYYRVNYDNELWNLLIKQLNGANKTFEAIHLRNRAQLIDDALHLARAGKINYGILFGLIDYTWQETDYIPWVATNRANTYLNRWLSGSALYPHYQSFMRTNVATLFNHLGTELKETDTRVDRYARTIAINLACQAQLPDCLRKTNEDLANFIYQGRNIAPDYVSVIYCNGMRQATNVLYQFMQTRLLSSAGTTERNNIISGIACMQDTSLLMNFFEFAITPNVTLTNTERLRVFTSVVTNGENILDTLLDFLHRNYYYINALSSSITTSILSNVASRIGSKSVFDKFVKLIEILRDESIISSANYNTYAASAGENMLWQNENRDILNEFFDDVAVETTTTAITTTTSGSIAESTTLGASNIYASLMLFISCLLIKAFM